MHDLAMLWKYHPALVGVIGTAIANAAITSLPSLTISSVALTTGTQFALATPGSGSDCRTVGTVAASASCNIAVTFTPTSTGGQSDTVSITDNAAGSPHTFPVSGTGVVQVLNAPAIVMFARNWLRGWIDGQTKP